MLLANWLLAFSTVALACTARICRTDGATDFHSEGHTSSGCNSGTGAAFQGPRVGTGGAIFMSACTGSSIGKGLTAKWKAILASVTPNDATLVAGPKCGRTGSAIAVVPPTT